MGKRSPEGKLKPWSMPIFFAKADYLVADNMLQCRKLLCKTCFYSFLFFQHVVIPFPPLTLSWLKNRQPTAPALCMPSYPSCQHPQPSCCWNQSSRGRDERLRAGKGITIGGKKRIAVSPRKEKQLVQQVHLLRCWFLLHRFTCHDVWQKQVASEAKKPWNCKHFSWV